MFASTSNPTAVYLARRVQFSGIVGRRCRFDPVHL